MNRSQMWGVVALAATLSIDGRATANIEPSSFDAESIGAGTTGMAYLENPSALAINPANLAGIEKGGMSVNLTPVFTVSEAPLAGQNTSVRSDLGFGPIPSIFGAARVGKRVVLGFGAYALGLFGATYSDVENIYGSDLTGDFKLTFVSGEAAVGVAVEILPNLDLGVTLRVPFAVQDANIPVELVTIIPVTATLSGAGYPGGRIGLTWRATSKIAASIMYRTQATNRLSGRLRTLEGPELSSKVKARFSTPNVLSGGVAVFLLNGALTLASELHVLFYEASNQAQTLTFEEGFLFDTVDIPLLWQNAFSLRFGLDYDINRLLSFRSGYVASSSATTKEGAQPVTPPPAWGHSFALGLGVHWKAFAIDLALQSAFSRGRVGSNIDQSGCEMGFFRVGCEGEYKTVNGSLSVQFVYKR
ncbi:MAG: outer membrane protein transport protein [Myxococcota bacterium]